MRTLGVRFIDLTGGEPLLHPHIDRIAAAAKDAGMITSITTNALLYPKWAERLRGNVDLLHFSIDGADAETHNRSRGVACFDAVFKSIGIAKSLGEAPDLLFTVTKDNYRALDAVYALAREHDLVLLLNPVFEYFREEQLPEEALDAIEEAGRRRMTYLNPSFVTLRRSGGNDPDYPLCKAVSRVIVISPDNELLLPCYHMHNERIPIGDDLRAAHSSERVRQHSRLEGRHAFCKGCTINCYFEPSFAFPTNLLSLAAVPSKIRYGYAKYILQPLRKR